MNNNLLLTETYKNILTEESKIFKGYHYECDEIVDYTNGNINNKFPEVLAYVSYYILHHYPMLGVPNSIFEEMKKIKSIPDEVAIASPLAKSLSDEDASEVIKILKHYGVKWIFLAGGRFSNLNRPEQIQKGTPYDYVYKVSTIYDHSHFMVSPNRNGVVRNYDKVLLYNSKRVLMELEEIKIKDIR